MATPELQPCRSEGDIVLQQASLGEQRFSDATFVEAVGDRTLPPGPPGLGSRKTQRRRVQRRQQLCRLLRRLQDASLHAHGFSEVRTFLEETRPPIPTRRGRSTSLPPPLKIATIENEEQCSSGCPLEQHFLDQIESTYAVSLPKPLENERNTKASTTSTLDKHALTESLL